MIQENELKIGNKVMYQCSPRHEKRLAVIKAVSTWPETTCVVDFGGKVPHTAYLQDISPIPITPEILEKAGFEIDKEVGLYEMRFLWQPHNNRTYFVYADSRSSLQICKNGVYAIESPCKYLHQLQNLYYSLTGQELNVAM